jgi:hypothetical protein
MPGLLQTSTYSRALLSQLGPGHQMRPTYIDELIEVRSRRQQRLLSGRVTLRPIIDEAVARGPVGGPEVMAEQVKSFIADAERPNAALQVIPFGKGLPPNLVGSFQLLKFPADEIDDIVFVDGLLANFLLDKKAEVNRYRAVLDDFGDRFALHVEQSLDWLADVAHVWHTRSRRPWRASSA